jgi:hypothetical protein
MTYQMRLKLHYGRHHKDMEKKQVVKGIKLNVAVAIKKGL